MSEELLHAAFAERLEISRQQGKRIVELEAQASRLRAVLVTLQKAYSVAPVCAEHPYCLHVAEPKLGQALAALKDIADD